MKKQQISRCELHHQTILCELEAKRQAAVTKHKARLKGFKAVHPKANGKLGSHSM